MEPHADLAAIHSRQAERAERAADAFIAGGGGVASLAGAEAGDPASTPS